MAKFKKRITKNIRQPIQDCLVIGNAYGFLDEVLDTFDTVFLYKHPDTLLKAKNLIYRQTLESAFTLPRLSAVFIDLHHVNIFDDITPILTGPRPDLFVEGNVVVLKDKTENLYRNGYRAVAQLGWCHQWSKIA